MTAASSRTRRIAAFGTITLAALLVEVAQHESVVKILLSVWLPALVLAIYWSAAGWPRALSTDAR